MLIENNFMAAEVRALRYSHSPDTQWDYSQTRRKQESDTSMWKFQKCSQEVWSKYCNRQPCKIRWWGCSIVNDSPLWYGNGHILTLLGDKDIANMSFWLNWCFFKSYGLLNVLCTFSWKQPWRQHPWLVTELTVDKSFPKPFNRERMLDDQKAYST